MASETRNNTDISGDSLRTVAAGEVARLRSMRSDLRIKREVIDRELITIDQLLKTFVSFDPSLRSADDIRRPRPKARCNTPGNFGSASE